MTPTFYAELTKLSGDASAMVEAVSAIESRIVRTHGIDAQESRSIAEIRGLLIHARDQIVRARGLVRDGFREEAPA